MSAAANGRSGKRRRNRAALALACLLPSPALAACPQELAVYAEREKSASIDFRPVLPGTGSHTSEFKIVFAQNGVVLDGIVQWTEGVPRPWGTAMHDCPEGDVTGEELRACTVWEGVIYAIDGSGETGLLPQTGADAAQQLLLPDFGASVRHSSAWGADGVSIVPWDVFQLSGCQE